MTRQTMTLEQLRDAMLMEEGMDGLAPATAAHELGVTRQAVFSAIRRGGLDAVSVVDRQGRKVAVLVTERALKAYMKRTHRPKSVQLELLD